MNSELIKGVTKLGEVFWYRPKKQALPIVENRPGTPQIEVNTFRAEIEKAKKEIEEPVVKEKNIELIPVRVSEFDKLINDGGLEKGSTILISGGCGTGKTTFVMQSIYNGALNGEKGVYVSFEEEPLKIKAHMMKNFGWNITTLEEKGLIAIIKVDPVKIARSVEAALEKKKGGLQIEVKGIEMPFKPDRIGIDSLSALSITFEEEENYRRYIRNLFEELEGYNSLNFVLAETEQNPMIYSRAGIEEFLADGVIVFYNLSEGNTRKKMLEILKIRSSNHEKRLVPYKISSKGIEIFPYKK